MATTRIKFEDFEKEIKVRYRKEKDWKIYFPYNTSGDDIRAIISLSRKYCLVGWHVIHTEPTEKNPEPEIKMYWEFKKEETHEE